MKQIILTLMLLLTMVWGKMDLYPSKVCALYNNLKHTKNRGSVTLDMTHTYTMLKHHKGQYLLKVPGATPLQRWVDDDCLTLRPLRGTPLFGKNALQAKKKHFASKTPSLVHEHKPKHSDRLHNLLALSWHNAFCETHRYKKECKRSFFSKRSSDDIFVLHGYWPQPRQKSYCNVPKRDIVADRHKQWHRLPEPKLTSETLRTLKAVMPGVDSNLHRHEWIKHGTCYGTNAERYFGDAATLTQQVNQSAVADLFVQYVGKRITLQRIREVFDESFGKGAGARVELHCKRGLITELWLHLGGRGDDLSTLLQRGKKVYSKCKRGIIDKAGYGR